MYKTFQMNSVMFGIECSENIGRMSEVSNLIVNCLSCLEKSSKTAPLILPCFVLRNLTYLSVV